MTAARVLLILALAPLCVTLGFAAGPDGRNWLLIAIMTLSPMALILPACRRMLPRIDFPLCAFILLITILSLSLHPDSTRWSSLAFSAGFVCLFMMTARLISAAALSASEVGRLLAAFIYAFAAFLLIQQIAVICGAAPPNYIYGYKLSKLNSLAVEASQSAFIVGTLLFFHGVASHIARPEEGLLRNIRRSPWPWIAAGWVLATTLAVTSMLMIPVTLLPWVSRRNAWAAVATTAAVVAGTALAAEIGVNPAERMVKFVKAVPSLDEKKLMEADSSGADRLIPAIRVARQLSPLSAGFWFGNGVDADLQAVGETEYTAEAKMSGNDMIPRPFAWMFHVWYNFGLIAYLLLLIPLFSICFVRRRPLWWLVTAAGIVMASMNNSIPYWLLLTLSLLCRNAAPPRSALHYARLDDGSEKNSTRKR